jgi:hypothetical protein
MCETDRIDGCRKMVRVNRKMMASGISGVLVASLVIVTIVMAPSSDLAKFFSFRASSISKETSPYLEPPLRINLSISPFEPNGLGGEANLTIIVTHLYWDSPDTLIEIYQVQGIGWFDRPKGVIFMSNNSLPWKVSLKANISVALNIRVKANQIGNWTIEVAARSFYASNLWYGDIVDLRVSIYEDKVLATYLGSLLDWNIGGVKLYIGNVTEPGGVGSEADLAIIFSRSKDMFNATLQISLPKGISLTSGNSTWSGDLKANVSISLKARIKFLEVGNWFVQVRGEGIVWVPTSLIDVNTGETIECFAPIPAIILGSIAVHVFTDKIAVSAGWMIY